MVTQWNHLLIWVSWQVGKNRKVRTSSPFDDDWKASIYWAQNEAKSIDFLIEAIDFHEPSVTGTHNSEAKWSWKIDNRVVSFCRHKFQKEIKQYNIKLQSWTQFGLYCICINFLLQGIISSWTLLKLTKLDFLKKKIIITFYHVPTFLNPSTAFLHVNDGHPTNILFL